MTINHSNLSLLMDLYELTMAQSYYRHRFKAQATFDLFVRHLPVNRSYLVFVGLEDVLRYLKNLKFTQDDLNYLERLGFGEDFLTYLGRLRFHGDVWAMPEGSIFFPGEPVVRITGSLIEAQIIESFLLNAVNLPTMVASKASRIVAAADGKGVYDFSLRRTQGIDAALKVARSAFISGFSGTSNVLASKLCGIPAVGTMAHSFVLSFSSEAESFRAYFDTFPNKSILLVDTYNIEDGIKNAIRVAEEFRAKGHLLQGIRLDSGNLAQQAKMARSMLDARNFRDVRIFASGDLDEYKIEKLIDSGAPIDDFGVGTRMGASADAPSLDIVYKLAEVTNEGGVFLPTMKLSRDKVTLPGRKQVFRRFDSRGFCKEDIVGLEHESPGEPLLKKVMHAGEVTYNFKPISEIKDRTAKNVATLKKEYRGLVHVDAYPVLLSKDLKKLVNGLEGHLKKS